MNMGDIQMPAGSWDSHVHVVDEDRFPFHPDHPYRPKRADLDDLLQFEKGLGVQNVCLVAVSVYKDDNSSIIDALNRSQGRARAVVCIDPETKLDSDLDLLHQAGVRGIRINLRTWGQRMTQQELVGKMWKHANRVRRLGWAMQMYIDLCQVPLIGDVARRLGVPIVLDHMASPDPSVPACEQHGYRTLLDLLRQGLVWVKISGVYRFSQLPDLDEYAKTLIGTNPDRVVWASDWPHTGGVGRNPGGDRSKHQDYRLIDDLQFVRRCFAWCGEQPTIIHRLFAENPRTLWTAADPAFERSASELRPSLDSASRLKGIEHSVRNVHPVCAEGLQA